MAPEARAGWSILEADCISRYLPHHGAVRHRACAHWDSGNIGGDGAVAVMVAPVRIRLAPGEGSMKFLIGLFVLLFVAIGAAEARAHDFTVVSYGLLHFNDGAGVGFEISTKGNLGPCTITVSWPARSIPDKPGLASDVAFQATPPAGEPLAVASVFYRIIAASGVVREGARGQFEVNASGRTKAVIKLAHPLVRALVEAGVREIAATIGFQHGEEFVAFLYQYRLAPTAPNPSPPIQPWRGPRAQAGGDASSGFFIVCPPEYPTFRSKGGDEWRRQTIIPSLSRDLV